MARRHALLVVAGLALACVVGGAQGRASAGPVSVAHLRLSPNGADANPCTPTSPCRSFNRAYKAAKPGQIVEVGGGAYGNQEIDSDPSKVRAARVVTFQPVAGARVVLNDLLTYASNVRYKGFTVTPGYGQPDIRGGHNVTVENVRATNLYISGPTRNVTIKGGSYGPYASCGGGSQIKTLGAGGDDPDPAAQPRDTVIDRVTFHDYTIPDSCPDAHLDCLHVFYHVGLTIRNSTFVNCAHYGVLLGSNGAGAAENDLIENNFFGPSGIAGFAFRGGTEEAFDTVTVRYNSGGAITPQTTQAELRNIKWYANVASELGTCRDGIDYRFNVVATGGCGRTDVRAATGFTNYDRGDMHLKLRAAAVGRGIPRDHPAFDIDGDKRPRGRVDAGADER